MESSSTTVAFIGCGNMGSALLLGLLDAIFSSGDEKASQLKTTRFIACTNTEVSAKVLEKRLGEHASRVQVGFRQNYEAMKEADVVVLGFKPWMAEGILGESSIREAIAGKLVISLLAGLSVRDLRQLILKGGEVEPDFYMSKAIPNLATRHRQSMTVLEQTPDDFPARHFDFLESMFGLVGQTKYFSEQLVDAASTVITTCIATLTVPLDGILDGAVVEGIRRQEAMDLVIQSVVGLGSLLANGDQPPAVREKVSSPKGCTIQTLVAVERKAVRGIFTDALLQGTQHLRNSK